LSISTGCYFGTVYRVLTSFWWLVVVVVPSQGIKQPGWIKNIDNSSIVQIADIIKIA
jgi:hypothetical protein